MPDQFYHQFADPRTLLDVLTRFVRGELGDAEQRVVERYLAEHGQDATFVAALAVVRSEYGIDSSGQEIDARVNALTMRIRSMPEESAAMEQHLQRSDARVRKLPLRNHSLHRDGPVGDPLILEKRTLRRRMGGLGSQPLQGWTWLLMAMITLVAGSVIAAWNTGGHHFSKYDTASSLTYTTANGQRANITLPDGSTVALNVASRLEVPADYATGHHTVRLVGEALFTVTGHQAMPFLVNAGSTTTRVLGTSFLVRHYPADTAVTVVVLNGKVLVHSVVLTAARQGVISRTGTIHVGPADLMAATFAKGVLTFDRIPLREAIGMLDRWFDADIRLQDSALGAQKVTGGFPPGSLSELTESLESAFGVRVVREGRVLTVYPR